MIRGKYISVLLILNSFSRRQKQTELRGHKGNRPLGRYDFDPEASILGYFWTDLNGKSILCQL